MAGKKDLKFDGGKPKWSLLMGGCREALSAVVDVLGFGAKKYEAHSWRAVDNGAERYKDALYRHMNAIERGEAADIESGLSHWAHVATNALFLCELDIAARAAKDDSITEAVRKHGLGAEQVSAAISKVNEDNGVPHWVGRHTISSADDWIVWNGGECPVPGYRVMIELRNGTVSSGLVANGFDWHHDDLPEDIIAYRVVKDAE
jgi:hypothetical protein